MEKETLSKSVEAVKTEASSSGKKFTQSIDLVMVLKLRKSKNATTTIDTLVQMPNRTREIKTCAFVDKDMSTQSTGVFSKVILKDDFGGYDKKKIKKLIKEHDYFFAEATIMPQIAAKFGKQLTAMNKMPNPKTGTIIAPAMDLKSVVERAKNAVKISAKKNNAITVKVGDQKMESEKISANVMAVYSAVKSALPEGDAAIKKIALKPTMGKLVTV